MITIGNNTKIKNSIIGSNKKREKDLEKENNNLKEDFKRHIDRINELTNRIDKAIEYIENNWIEYSDFQYVDNDDELDIDCESIKELVDILKGSDTEVKQMNTKDDIKLLIKDLEENIYDYCGDYGTLEHRLEDTLCKILNILKVISGSDSNGYNKE